MSELKSPGKPFEIVKAEVWQAWEKVKANKGAPGISPYVCALEVGSLRLVIRVTRAV